MHIYYPNTFCSAESSIRAIVTFYLTMGLDRNHRIGVLYSKQALLLETTEQVIYLNQAKLIYTIFKATKQEKKPIKIYITCYLLSSHISL